MSDLHQFLNKYVDKTHLNKVLSELTFVLQPSDPDACTNSFLQLCADLKYKQYISECPKNFIIGLDPYPKIRTSCDVYGIRTPAAQTLYNRTKPICKIHGLLESNLPMYADGQYPWLNDVPAVVTATQQAYTKQSTFNLGKLAVIQLCEALGQTDLKSQYFEVFAALPEMLDADDGPSALTKEEVRNIRKLNQVVIDKAILLIDNKGAQATCREMSVILEAFAVETLYGCSQKHEPLRNDWIDIIFQGDLTDTQTANYISIEPDAVTLTVNTAHKIGKLKQPLVVNLSETSPRLASLLRKVHPIAVEVQGTDQPYVLWSKKKKVSASQLSTRMVHVWEKLGYDPGVSRRGCNGARHASVNENRKRRRLTEDERAVEQDQARRRCSSVKMAEEVYAQS
jgi:hypothetical protein